MRFETLKLSMHSAQSIYWHISDHKTFWIYSCKNLGVRLCARAWYVRMFVRAFVACVFTCICTCVCTSVCAYVCACVCSCVCSYVLYVCTCVCTRVCTCVFTYICTCAGAYVCTCVCTKGKLPLNKIQNQTKHGRTGENVVVGVVDTYFPAFESQWHRCNARRCILLRCAATDFFALLPGYGYGYGLRGDEPLVTKI